MSNKEIDIFIKNVVALQSHDLTKRQQAARKIDDAIISMHYILYGDCDPSPHCITNLIPKLLTRDIFSQFVKYILIKDFEIQPAKLEIMITGYIRQHVIPMDTIPIFMKYFPVDKCENEISSKTKSYTAGIMTYMIRRCSKYKVDEYIDNVMVQSLLRCYKDQCLTQVIGTVLQEMVKRSELAPLMLQTNIVDQLFDLVQKPSFDIAADAYKTLQLLLTRNKKLVSAYLQTNYVGFFSTFNTLVQSHNYVTQRQSLNLLSEILLERSNFSTMIRYIAEKKHLKIAMILLKNDSNAIAHEAFHIFKVFVANPKKARDIHIVLWKNKNKLIMFLQNFLPERTVNDEQFAEEKKIVIEYLKNLLEPQVIMQHRIRKQNETK